jgi:hypothetical protein
MEGARRAPGVREAVRPEPYSLTLVLAGRLEPAKSISTLML